MNDLWPMTLLRNNPILMILAILIAAQASYTALQGQKRWMQRWMQRWMPRRWLSSLAMGLGIWATGLGYGQAPQESESWWLMILALGVAIASEESGFVSMKISTS